MTEFTYTENADRYDPLFSQKLVDLRCKHVLRHDSEKAKDLYRRSNRFGYPQVVWGYGAGIYRNEDANRIIQIQTIRRMIYKQLTQPFRLVIDDGGVLWVDNLHSCIRDILVYGTDVRLRDTRFYLIDLARYCPIVVNRGDTLSRNLDDIEGAIWSAQKRNSRTNPQIRQVNYTIGEFMAENEITTEALQLPPEMYDAYLYAVRGGGA